MSARDQANRGGRVQAKGLDYAPTHPWATRALCAQLLRMGEPLHEMTAREPACGEGHMARPLAEYFRKVLASDVKDYGRGYRVRNYLTGRAPPRTNWTITNPPFDDAGAEKFAARALAHSSDGVAIFAPTRFVETPGRYERLFSRFMPTEILQFVERVPLLMGKLDPDSSTATAYAWFVWRRKHAGKPTEFIWLAPCAHQLKRASDYR